MTSNKQKHLEALSEIRTMMERSSRFISLSGLSGVAAGFWALVGAAVAFAYLGKIPFSGSYYHGLSAGTEKWGMPAVVFFAVLASLVLVLALFSGIYFTTRRARRKGLPIWGQLTRRLLWNLAIPLVGGGLFCLALLKQGMVLMVAPATLVFYGLALLNASKYTLNDIRYLGMTEIGLGVLAAFMPGYGLEFWTIGFGALHIIYGMAMYWKYEREL
jgi:hypothetical protein